MTKTDFYEELYELLLTQDPILATTNLQELEEFDSLAIMGLVAIIDENFSMTVSGKKLSKVATVNDLMTLIGDTHFTD